LARPAKLERWAVAQNTACVCSHLNLLCPSPGSPTPDARILRISSRSRLLTKLVQRDTNKISDNSSEFHRVRVLDTCWKYVQIVRSGSYVPCRITKFQRLNPHGRFNSVPGHQLSSRPNVSRISKRISWHSMWPEYVESDPGFLELHYSTQMTKQKGLVKYKVDRFGGHRSRLAGCFGAMF